MLYELQSVQGQNIVIMLQTFKLELMPRLYNTNCNKMQDKVTKAYR